MSSNIIYAVMRPAGTADGQRHDRVGSKMLFSFLGNMKKSSIPSVN